MLRSFGLQVFACRASSVQSAKINIQVLIGCGAVEAVQVVAYQNGQTGRIHAHNQYINDRQQAGWTFTATQLGPLCKRYNSKISAEYLDKSSHESLKPSTLELKYLRRSYIQAG